MYYIKIRDTVTKAQLYLAYDNFRKEYYWTQLSEYAKKFKKSEVEEVRNIVISSYLFKRATNEEITAQDVDTEFIF